MNTIMASFSKNDYIYMTSKILQAPEENISFRQTIFAGIRTYQSFIIKASILRAKRETHLVHKSSVCA